MKDMKVWIVEYADEACGMVRYDTREIEAKSAEEAKAKFNESVYNSGPGIFAIGAVLKQKDQ